MVLTPCSRHSILGSRATRKVWNWQLSRCRQVRLFAQVIVGSGLSALGAEQVGLGIVIVDMDPHFLVRHVKFDAADLPGGGEAEQLSI